MRKLLSILAASVCFAACSSNDAQIAIVPYPNHVESGRGSFAVAGQIVGYDRQADSLTVNAIRGFAAQLGLVTGVESPVVALGKTSDATICFIVEVSLPAEGYELEVTKEGVDVRASQFPGFFYALQSLKQLLPAAVYGQTPALTEVWEMPCVKIADEPRFAYRGMHLDVSRHFFPVEVVKRYIDALALHKLNTFHWHLTDDQGWRIEIKRYPKLTSVGGMRKGTVIGKDWGSSDNIPYGGFYTQDEIREVVAYAAERAITVVPEVDLPGHMLAALTAYPELGCTGGPYDVWQRWGVADDVLCPGRDGMFEFLEGVLTEVMEMFPSELINIGGDECPKVRWEQCPRCQARIRELGLKDQGEETAEHFLQSYVTTRIGKFLSEHGRRLAGWDEILEGGASSDATVLAWRGIDRGIAAAKSGHDVVLCPVSHCYFDYYQSSETDAEPFGIGGYVPVERIYSLDPALEGLTPEELAHVIGVQANIWTEYIADSKHLEYMLLPRLAALSEVQWCQPEVKNWDRFVGGFKMGDIYRTLGYEFATHIFGVTGAAAVNPEKGCVEMTLSTQGDAPIHYTLDGSEPSAASPRYEKPVEVTASCTFTATALRENMQTRPYVREIAFSKATARPTVLNSAPTLKYTFGGALALVDGYRGGAVYSNGAWVGFLEEPLDVTIDMGGKTTYSSAAVEVLVQRGEEVFPPSELEALVSDNGTDFMQVGVCAVPAETVAGKDGVRKYKVEFPETSARYLRVVARTVNPLPEWFSKQPRKGHLFVDEIMVE